MCDQRMKTFPVPQTMYSVHSTGQRLCEETQYSKIKHVILSIIINTHKILQELYNINMLCFLSIFFFWGGGMLMLYSKHLLQRFKETYCFHLQGDKSGSDGCWMAAKNTINAHTNNIYHTYLSTCTSPIKGHSWNFKLPFASYKPYPPLSPSLALTGQTSLNLPIQLPHSSSSITSGSTYIRLPIQW